MMVFRWKDDHTPLVLELLRDHECLWNTKNIYYRNKTARESALSAVARDLKLPVTPDDLRLKIKTIRTRYSFELSRVLRAEKSAAGPEQVYVPKLSWYKQADSFLRAFCVPRSIGFCSTKVNYPRESLFVEIHGHDTYDDDEQTTDGNTNTDDDGDIVYEDMTDDKLAVRREIEKQNMTSPEHRSTGIGAKRSSHDEISFNSSASVKTRKLSDIDSGNGSQNEFDLFCKSLAVQLKNMPLQRALLCQQQLQQVMTNERLFQLSNPDVNSQLSSLQISSSIDSDALQESSLMEEDTSRNNILQLMPNRY